MAMNSLKDVYVDQLQDLHSACRQSLKATRQMHDVAHHEELKAALKDGADGIERGIEELERLCRSHGADPREEHCKGMEGLVAEARAHALDADFGSDDVRDAMIVSQYQRMAHYAIAGYGCLLAYAGRLGLGQDESVLRECLDSCYDGDRRLTQIATDRINAVAA